MAEKLKTKENGGKRRTAVGRLGRSESEGWLKRSSEKRHQCQDIEVGTRKVHQSKVTGRGYV